MTYKEEVQAAKEKKEAEVGVGNVFTTAEMTKKFNPKLFAGPGLCFATDRETGEEVTLYFQHSPRIYWRVVST